MTASFFRSSSFPLSYAKGVLRVWVSSCDAYPRHTDYDRFHNLNALAATICSLDALGSWMDACCTDSRTPRRTGVPLFL